jgi:D-amino-acid dehydrogenase
LLAWLARFARSATREHVERAAPLLRDLCLASRASYEEFAAQSGADFGFVREGLLLLCRTQQTFAHETEAAAHARRLGMPAEVHSPAEAIALEPIIRTDLAGAIYYPLDCHLAPDLLMTWLERAVVRLGGRIVWQAGISGWHRERDTLVAARTDMGEEIEAHEFVLCAGSWSPHAARTLGVSLPIQAGKGYSVTLPEHPNPPRHCALLCEARVAVTPMSGRVRVGGTMELAGLDRGIDARRAAAVVDALGNYYTALKPVDFAGIEPWSGLRPCTPDGLPYVGRTRALRNFTVAAGHAMLGVSLGPATGRIVAQLLAGETPPFDMAMLSPERFA